MYCNESFRCGKCQRYKHDLLTFQIAVRYIKVHDGRMTRDCRSNFDCEFIIRSLQIVVTEVEHTDTSISVQCINDVTTSLVRDLAVRHIKLTDGV